MAKRKTSKSRSKPAKTNHIGAKPIPNLGEAAPPFAGYYPGPHSIFYRRSPQEREQRARESRASDQAKHERVRQIWEKCRELMADSNVRMYWLGQAQTVIATETSWQGSGGACLQYEWPRDKTMVYAVLAIWLDDSSSIRVLSDNLRQTDFYKANKNIGTEIERCDSVAAEFLSYIEADLKAEGLLGQKKEPEKVLDLAAQGRTKTLGTAENGTNRDNLKMSRPLFPKQWASIFGVSTSTIRKWEKLQTYAFKKKSARKWVLPIQDLPAEYLQRYEVQRK